MSWEDMEVSEIKLAIESYERVLGGSRVIKKLGLYEILDKKSREMEIQR